MLIGMWYIILNMVLDVIALVNSYFTNLATKPILSLEVHTHFMWIFVIKINVLYPPEF